jgi:hypothetical protein
MNYTTFKLFPGQIPPATFVSSHAIVDVGFFEYSTSTIFSNVDETRFISFNKKSATFVTRLGDVFSESKNGGSVFRTVPKFETFKFESVDGELEELKRVDKVETTTKGIGKSTSYNTIKNNNVIQFLSQEHTIKSTIISTAETEVISGTILAKKPGQLIIDNASTLYRETIFKLNIYDVLKNDIFYTYQLKSNLDTPGYLQGSTKRELTFEAKMTTSDIRLYDLSRYTYDFNTPKIIQDVLKVTLFSDKISYTKTKSQEGKATSKNFTYNVGMANGISTSIGNSIILENALPTTYSGTIEDIATINIITRINELIFNSDNYLKKFTSYAVDTYVVTLEFDDYKLFIENYKFRAITAYRTIKLSKNFGNDYVDSHIAIATGTVGDSENPITIADRGLTIKTSWVDFPDNLFQQYSNIGIVDEVVNYPTNYSGVRAQKLGVVLKNVTRGRFREAMLDSNISIDWNKYMNNSTNEYSGALGNFLVNIGGNMSSVRPFINCPVKKAKNKISTFGTLNVSHGSLNILWTYTTIINKKTVTEESIQKSTFQLEGNSTINYTFLQPFRRDLFNGSRAFEGFEFHPRSIIPIRNQFFGPPTFALIPKLIPPFNSQVYIGGYEYTPNFYNSPRHASETLYIFYNPNVFFEPVQKKYITFEKESSVKLTFGDESNAKKYSNCFRTPLLTFRHPESYKRYFHGTSAHNFGIGGGVFYRSFSNQVLMAESPAVQVPFDSMNVDQYPRLTPFAAEVIPRFRAELGPVVFPIYKNAPE